MNGLSEWLKEHGDFVFASKVILLTLVAFSIMVFGIFQWDIAYCNTLSRLNTDRQFRWETFGGCYVKTNSGLWITADGNWHIEIDK